MHRGWSKHGEKQGDPSVLHGEKQVSHPSFPSLGPGALPAQGFLGWKLTTGALREGPPRFKGHSGREGFLSSAEKEKQSDP